jgi:hypothetical protein
MRCPNPWCDNEDVRGAFCPECDTLISRLDGATSNRGIIEVKHWSPFDGCHWEWNYWYVNVRYSPDPEVTKLDTIHFRTEYEKSTYRPHHNLTSEVALQICLKTVPMYNKWIDLDGFNNFSQPMFYPITDKLNDIIARPLLPKVWNAIPDGFLWTCDRCNRGIRSYSPDPRHASWGGDGWGIQYMPNKFYCKRCWSVVGKE